MDPVFNENTYAQFHKDITPNQVVSDAWGEGREGEEFGWFGHNVS
jgi:hypothetical protein